MGEQVKGLAHVAFNVSDMDKAIQFYQDVLGFEKAFDLKNPKTNHFNPGFSDQERQKMRDLLGLGFADTFRTLYPEKVEYSWWSYRFNSRAKNVGWRIDYFIVSQRLMNQVKDSVIYGDILGSDHCPVGVEIEF